MKNTVVIFALLFAFPILLRAQIGWTKYPIATSYMFASWVYAIDLDQDNDMDVLGTSYEDYDITWWENDGNQNFAEHTIDSNFGGAYCVHAIDIDGDNDIDVVGAATLFESVAAPTT